MSSVRGRAAAAHFGLLSLALLVVGACTATGTGQVRWVGRLSTEGSSATAD